MDVLIMRTGQQMKHMQRINKRFSESNNKQAFDDILKIEGIKEDRLNKANHDNSSEKKNIQNQSIENKEKNIKKSNLNDKIDSTPKEYKNNLTEDIPEDVINLIAFLDRMIEKLNINYKNDENQKNVACILEDFKLQLLSTIEKNNTANVSLNISSNEKLLELMNGFEMLLEQNNSKIQLEDFNNLFSKLTELFTTNKNEDTNIFLSNSTPKSNLTILNTKNCVNTTENSAKDEVFSNTKNETDTNIKNEIEMFNNKKNDTKAGFFASKHEKVVIPNKSIEDIPTQYSIQKNVPIMENTKLETTNLNKPNFYNILGQVVERAQVLIGEKGSEMTLQLKPDHLGNLSMKISVERGIVVANIIAENQTVKEVLEANFNLLKDALNEKGFGIQELNVSVGQDSSFKEQQNFMRFKKKHTVKTFVSAVEYEQQIFIEDSNGMSASNSTINHLG